MPNILALDTSCEQLSIALQVGESCLSAECPAGQSHSDFTLPIIQTLLEEANLTLAQLDGMAISVGPGAFTGLRIGCGLVQGMAFAHNIPVFTCTTLEALAEAQPPEIDFVCAAIDARMQQIYLAAYQRDATQISGWRTEIAPCLIDAQSLPALNEANWHFVGNAFHAYPVLQQDLNLANIQEYSFPHATAILSLARKQMAAGQQGIAAAALDLLYLRDKVALTTIERQNAERAK